MSYSRRKQLLCNLFTAHLEVALETSEKASSVCVCLYRLASLSCSTNTSLYIYLFFLTFFYTFFPKGFRELWPSRIPTITGSTGRRASWCFLTNLSCATAVGTGWQSRSEGTEWWRAQGHRPKGRGGALSTLNFSGMKGNEWAQKEHDSCLLLVVIRYL